MATIIDATMTAPQSRTGESAADALHPVLLLLFIGSGCAALIYEIVWFQLLQLVIGISAISLAVVLGTSMGGMCIGSLGLARVISRQPHPMRVYAIIEGGIGLFGLLELFMVPWAGGLYSAIGGHGLSGLLVRGVFCAIVFPLNSISPPSGTTAPVMMISTA